MLTARLRALRHRGDDAGFTLLEVVMAMLVFAVMVTGVLGVVTNTLDVTRSNTHRVAAANLATKQIESTRSLRTLDIPEGMTTRTETVANTVFTITQTANYVVAGSSNSVCQGSGNQLAYKLVNVTVTWPNMGRVAPVRSDTLKALGVGDSGLDPTKGSLAVAVKGATGGAVAGVAVTISPSNVTRLTGPDGCAVFVNLDAGVSYTAQAAQAGFVGAVNAPVTSLSQGVAAGTVTRAELTYDRTRSATVAWAAPVGHLPPAGLPLRYRSSYVSDGAFFATCPAGGSACTTGVPGLANNLFPAVYEMNAGTCVDARTGKGDVDLVSGDGALTVPLAGFRVTVRDVGGVPRPGRAVTATHAPESDPKGCTSGATWSLAATGATGTTASALPFGTWTFSTANGVAAVQATVANPGNPVADVVLVVTS